MVKNFVIQEEVAAVELATKHLDTITATNNIDKLPLHEAIALVGQV